jgi:hypothetical protein
LRDIFARIADHPINRIDELLPWTWKAFADKLQGTSKNSDSDCAVRVSIRGD